MGININIYNAILFNVAWLLCVLGGNKVAVITSVVALVIHLRYIGGDMREIKLFLQVVLLGFFVDSLFIYSDVLVGPNAFTFPPVWLLSLWLVFATTLNHCLSWFQQHLFLAFIVGAVAGPMSYLAGTKMTEFDMGTPAFQSILIVSVAWSLLFPICLLLAKSYDRKTRFG